MKNYEVIIIGAGPAGISAAVYAKRANKSVLVFYHGESQLEQAHQIDNYYGFPQGISGQALYENGIAQAKALDVAVKNEEVTHIEITADMRYRVQTATAAYESSALILATGNKKLKPSIAGLDAFEGKGVSYCAICDGFFYRGKTVAVLGNGAYALSEAADLENVAEKVYLLTNGKEAPETDKYEVITSKIKEIQGQETVNAVLFEDGVTLALSGIFIAQGVAGGADFAKKLGVALQGDSVQTDDAMATNLPGVFACGNLTGGLLQICKAVYEGAQAGLSAVKYIKSKEE